MHKMNNNTNNSAAACYPICQPLLWFAPILVKQLDELVEV